MVLILESGTAVSNVTKIEEGPEDYVLVYSMDLAAKKIPLGNIKTIHPEW